MTPVMASRSALTLLDLWVLYPLVACHLLFFLCLLLAFELLGQNLSVVSLLVWPLLSSHQGHQPRFFTMSALLA